MKNKLAPLPEIRRRGGYLAPILPIEKAIRKLTTYPIFKPGAFKAGDIVQNPDGTLWKAAKDIGYASALPKENVYWDAYGTQQPVTTDFQGRIQAPLVHEVDNHAKLQTLIDKQRRATILLPNGRFKMSQSLMWAGRTIRLIGADSTTFQFPANTTGIKIFTDFAGDNGRSELERIILHGGSGDDLNAHGIDAGGLIDLERVMIRNFAGNGVNCVADIADKQRYNTSHNLFQSVEVIECGGDGFYFQGGDASMTVMIRCDSRDCAGHAVDENSFLGGVLVGHMAHANKKGHYRAENGNNRTTVVGSYGEQDSPESRFGGQTYVFGGLHGWRMERGNDGKLYYPENPEIPYTGNGGYILTSPQAKVFTH